MDARPKLRQSNRSKLDIIATVLNVAKKPGARKTRILYGANLSFQMTDKYLQFLCERDLLRRRVDNYGTTIYETTNKGIKFLQVFDELKQFSVVPEQLIQ